MSKSPVKIGVLGCFGKVGSTLVHELYLNHPQMLAGGVDNPLLYADNKDLGANFHLNIGINVSKDINDLCKTANVLIDFTNSTSSIEYIKVASEIKKPIIVGTTGFNDTQELLIKEYSQLIPIVKSSNMSLGVNVLFKIIELASTLLSENEYDIEIVEKHHKHKIDAPSGTALTIGNIIAKIKNKDLASMYHPPRKGITKGREVGKIGFSSIRGGDLKGEHSVLFIGNGEVLELKHTANSRDIFISGAIKAAMWIIDQPPGLYNLQDSLNIPR